MAADRNTTIRSSQLRNLSVTAEDLKNASITGDKLIDGTISGSKIADDTISQSKLSFSNFNTDYGSIASISGTYSGEILTVTVDDASAVFGDALYCAADFNYEKASAISFTASPAVAIAVASGSGSKDILLRGQVCNTDWNWSAGLIYLSTTSGVLTQTPPSSSGEQIQPLGWALSADTIFFTGHIGVIEI